MYFQPSSLNAPPKPLKVWYVVPSFTVNVAVPLLVEGMLACHILFVLVVEVSGPDRTSTGGVGPEAVLVAVLDVVTTLVVVTVLLVVTTPPSDSVDVPTTTVVPTWVVVPVRTVVVPVEALPVSEVDEPFDSELGPSFPGVVPEQAARKARLTPAARAPATPPPVTAERRRRKRVRGCCVSGCVMPLRMGTWRTKLSCGLPRCISGRLQNYGLTRSCLFAP
jgi:hypothetical protein